MCLAQSRILTVFQYFHSFYGHGSKIVRRCYLMFQIFIDPYWGAFLSNIALNVRKSHLDYVKFLHATFASLSLRKRKHFSFVTFSRFTHLSATIITSQCIALPAIAARQKFFTGPTAAYEQHFRHTHCLFLLFFTLMEY